MCDIALITSLYYGFDQRDAIVFRNGTIIVLERTIIEADNVDVGGGVVVGIDVGADASVTNGSNKTNDTTTTTTTPTLNDITANYSNCNIEHNIGEITTYIKQLIKLFPHYEAQILTAYYDLSRNIYFDQPVVVYPGDDLEEIDDDAVLTAPPKSRYGFIYDKKHPYVICAAIDPSEKTCLKNKLFDLIWPEIYAFLGENIVYID